MSINTPIIPIIKYNKSSIIKNKEQKTLNALQTPHTHIKKIYLENVVIMWKIPANENMTSRPANTDFYTHFIFHTLIIAYEILK